MRAVHLWAAPGPRTNKVADPGTSLTIAVEDWQQAEVPTPAGATRCGIAIVGDDGAPVVQRDGRRNAPRIPSPRRRPTRKSLRWWRLRSISWTRRKPSTQIAGRADAGLPGLRRDHRPTVPSCLAAHRRRRTSRHRRHRGRGLPRRRWPRCTAASASNSATRPLAASISRPARSTSRPRPPPSTCCSVMPV